MTVNVKHNRLWVEALRSGKYRQGKNHLRVPLALGDGFGYCCLGVAVEVAVENGLDLTENPYLDNAFPGKEVVDWYGWEKGNPYIGVIPHACADPDCDSELPLSASGANDAEGWTFGQIADGVEQFIIGKGKTDA